MNLINRKPETDSSILCKVLAKNQKDIDVQMFFQMNEIE
jgi:hypothetical protein